MTKKIMVVDDNADTIELVRAILGLNNFEAQLFIKPQEALDELKKGIRPDLIILDVRMPDISGPEFCKRVREDPSTKDIKIVYFTASSDADDKVLHKHGVLGFIFKPFDNEKLVKEINHYLDL